MLVISRKSQESVVVGGANGFEHVLTITVLGISGERVKLGFDVDPSIPVHRSEVWERINIGEHPDRPAEGASPL